MLFRVNSHCYRRSECSADSHFLVSLNKELLGPEYPQRLQRLVSLAPLARSSLQSGDAESLAECHPLLGPGIGEVTEGTSGGVAVKASRLPVWRALSCTAGDAASGERTGRDSSGDGSSSGPARSGEASGILNHSKSMQIRMLLKMLSFHVDPSLSISK